MPGMSATPGLTSPPRPAPTDGRPSRLPSPFSLPVHMFRILGRCWIGLTLWFAAGELVRFALIYLGTEISHGDYRQVRLVLTMLIFTILVAARLVVIVGMLYTVRDALTEIRARRAEGNDNERFLEALDRVAPAFAVIYLTWGIVSEDAYEFVRFDAQHRLDEPVIAALQKVESTAARGLIDMDVTVSAVLMAAAWVVGQIYGRMYDNGKGRFSGSIAAFAELAFFLFGLNATLMLINERSDWLAHRSVIAGTSEMIEDAKGKIPGWEAFWTWVGEVWPYAVEALVLPLMWLAVAILVYGADVNDTRAAIRGTRLDAAAAQLDRTHKLTRLTVAKVTTSMQERWIPIFHALRLTVRGGAPLYGMLCLCYVGLQIAAWYGERGVRHLVGGDTSFDAIVAQRPVETVFEFLLTVLTMCLLAATFDIASTRARAMNAGDGSSGARSRAVNG
ncbi:hypothetical protein SAMN04489764_2191 [Thermostaphylospora chromogena]|uniref:Uncharacterized protein n=2 Tax=Thermostaphylospora chromogena TaxID=35622 RepID=A0A1H1DVQ5_9ACTN|nr:hypothetical protein SAMN04489764_2191 [Thermostaphylospora chromogena]